MLQEVLAKAVEFGDRLTLSEIEFLLTLEKPEDLAMLWQAADQVRSRYMGDEIWLRGLLEFSNYCTRNCMYCGIRCGNQRLQRYRMTKEEILKCVDSIVTHNIGTVVLQSGEDPWWTAERIADLVASVKGRYDIAVTLSVGYRPRADYKLWREAGADRYLIRHEAANPDLYSSVHPDSTLDERVEALISLKDLGYETGSGCIVGLPGQTAYDLALDIDLARKLEVDMFGVGPFIPHPDTPLGKAAGGTAVMTYKVIAVARLVLRDVHMPVTTALATLEPMGRELGWQRGANVVMPNATPNPYRERYELYQNKRCLDDALSHCTGCLARRIASVNRLMGRGYGGSYKWKGRLQ